MGIAALGAAAHGQFGPDPGDSFTELKVGSPLAVPGKKAPIILRAEDTYQFEGSATVYSAKDVRTVPIGVAVIVNGKDGVQRATVARPRSQQTFGVYPGTIFSLAGQLFDTDTNAFEGGTQSIVGTTFTLDSVSNLDNGRRFEFGGFYFTPDKHSYNDLFQVAARYFPNRQVGFQIAYIDSTEFKASSASYHLLLDISTQGAGVTKGVQITSRLGVGVLTNFTKNFDPSNNVASGRTSTNFSTFVDVSLSLTKRLQLNATEWFIRDRNADINRFGLGLSYKL